VPPATTTSKREVIETYRREDKDTGSPEVQIAVLTQRIKHLTEHLRAARHDNRELSPGGASHRETTRAGTRSRAPAKQSESC